MLKMLCVYCSSSDRIAPKYFAAATELGVAMPARGWGLVYGGGKTGLMGAVARGVKGAGGRVTGVIPEFMKARELAFTEADELITVETMRERKQLMMERAVAFVALPGGWGTLEELLEVLVLAHLEILPRPVVILNQDGYYDDLLRLFERILAEKFMHATIRAKFAVVRTVPEILDVLDNWRDHAADTPWFQTK